jgi:hypothetical protein
LSKGNSAKTTPPAKRRFKFDWAGGLEDLKDQFTAVELQHRLNEQRAPSRKFSHRLTQINTDGPKDHGSDGVPGFALP